MLLEIRALLVDEPEWSQVVEGNLRAELAVAQATSPFCLRPLGLQRRRKDLNSCTERVDESLRSQRSRARQPTECKPNLCEPFPHLPDSSFPRGLRARRIKQRRDRHIEPVLGIRQVPPYGPLYLLLRAHRATTRSGTPTPADHSAAATKLIATPSHPSTTDRLHHQDGDRTEPPQRPPRQPEQRESPSRPRPERPRTPPARRRSRRSPRMELVSSTTIRVHALPHLDLVSHRVQPLPRQPLTLLSDPIPQVRLPNLIRRLSTLRAHLPGPLTPVPEPDHRPSNLRLVVRLRLSELIARMLERPRVHPPHRREPHTSGQTTSPPQRIHQPSMQLVRGIGGIDPHLGKRSFHVRLKRRQG